MTTSNNIIIKNKNLYCENAIRLKIDDLLEITYRRDLYLCRMALMIHLRQQY